MRTRIPDDLLAGAYFAQNGEPAWARNDALNVIAWATTSCIPVLGVEIWIPTTPGPTIPTPFIYTFEPTQVQGESKSQLGDRANGEAAEYVRSFDWDQGDTVHHGIEPFFNITFGEA